MTYIKQRLEDTDWQILVFKTVLFIWVVSLPFKNAIYQISFVMLDLFFITHLLCTQNFGIIKDILYKTRFLGLAFAGIVLSMVISNLLNPEYLSSKSWSHTILFIFRYGLIFVALAYFYRLDYFSKKEIIYFIFAGLILLGMTAVFYLAITPGLVSHISGGLSGSLGSRTGFGLFVGLGFVLSFVLIKNKILMPFLVIFFTFFTVFSFARSSWVASTVAIAIFLILKFKKIEKKHIILLITLAILIAIFYLSYSSLQNRVEALISLNTTYRTLIWQYSLDMILQNPLFGYGISSFGNLPNSPILQSPDWNSTHNLILETLLYTGIFGSIFCLYMITMTFIKAFKTKNYELFSVFTYLFIISQFDFGAYMSKELLSFIVIFTFLTYLDDFKEQN